MLRVAFAQVRDRPASFVAVAATALLAVATITAFSSLIAADIATPDHVKGAATDDTASLGVIAGIFGEGAIVVSLFVMLNCIGFALRQQLRDLALLRTIAATPRQVRRLVRRQVLLIVAAVAPPGWLAGSAGAIGSSGVCRTTAMRRRASRSPAHRCRSCSPRRRRR